MSGAKSVNVLTFDQCVRAIGGTCLDDVLGHAPNNRDNADYFFESDNVIAELKCLSNDPLTSPGTRERHQRLYDSWVREGRVMPSPKGQKIRFNLQDLPESCALEVLKTLKVTLDQNCVKQANKQIKHTKTFLDRPNAKGLLLLMNEGNYSHEPSVMLNLLFHVFNRGARSAINQVVVFTSDFASTVPVNPRGGYYWISPSIQGRGDVPADLLRRLSHQWGIALRAKRPEITESWEVSGATPDWIDRIKHIRPGN